MAAAAAASSTSTAPSVPSFSAPEGAFTQTSLAASFGELPLSGHALNSTAESNANNNSNSTAASPSPLGGTSMLLGPGATIPAAVSSLSPSPSNQTNNPDSVAASAGPPPMPVSHLPLSWRKEVGPTIEASMSTCSVPWPGTTALNPETGAASSSKRKGGQNESAEGSTAATASSSGGSSTNGRHLQSKGTGLRHNIPDPVIEGALVSQGIDAPPATTTGGQGGILGMSSLASYGFLPTSNGQGGGTLDLDRQLSMLSVRSETGPASLYKPPKNPPKPKNAVRQSNSSFVVKTQIHPDLKDVLTQLEKAAGEGSEPMVFTQRGRTLLWLADATGKREPLGRFLFASPPSAHDVNQLTRSPSVLDVIIGFPTGDILWLDALGLRYSRFNKGGLVTDSGVTKIRWLPSATHQGLFVSAHADGTMIVWDREREDCEVHKGWSPRSWSVKPNRRQREAVQRLREGAGGIEEETEVQAAAAAAAGAGARGSSEMMEVLDGPPDTPTSSTPARKSTLPSLSLPANAWDPKRSILVSRPGADNATVLATSAGGIASPNNERNAMPGLSGMSTPGSTTHPGGGDEPPSTTGSSLLSRGLGSQRRREASISQSGAGPNAVPSVSVTGSGDEPSSLSGSTTFEAPTSTSTSASTWTKNPLTHWRISASSRLNDFAISPDLGCIAVAGEDGLLRIIDLTTEKLIACHASYFGPFLSLAWSPDGRFLLATSCDDLVSIYHPRDSGAAAAGGGSESRLVARCVGHSSWVRDVAFDPYRWREGDRTYRFGSVGEDGKVLLWDFSGASLARPKGTAGSAGRGRPGSATGGHHASPHGAPLHRHGRSSRGHDSPAGAAPLGEDDMPDSIYHPAPPRQQVAQLNPISTYQASQLTSLLGIRFRPSNMLLFYSNGIMQIFERPTVKLLRIGSGQTDAEAAAAGGAEGQRSTDDDKAKAGKKKTGVSFGGTLSRGMRWVGGGQGGPAGPDSQTGRAGASNTAPVAMLG
ncbi:WD40 repeat-like protein [Jaminaea rosea]|uniref:WD40 repeat-like protein n=1 Tax=Jaminaea rosea TaxID=1569628 RepID=A0A316ULB2_9BASI|nr:WD40 repeat-like protein [Jaminaea rosea]PWN26030.1 WD40 repeat-like protein [Jaminaea rosea]